MRRKVNACGSVGQWKEALHLIANFCKEHHQPEAISFVSRNSQSTNGSRSSLKKRILNTLQRDAGKYVYKSTTSWFRLGGRNDIEYRQTMPGSYLHCSNRCLWGCIPVAAGLGPAFKAREGLVRREFTVDSVDLRTVLECFAVVSVDGLLLTGGCNCLQHGHQRLRRCCRVAERPDAFAGCEVCRHAKLLGKTLCKIRN